MSAANVLVALRIALGLPIAAIVISTPHADPAYLGALGLFCLGVATDVADGALARRRGAVSALGAFLDPLADKVLTLAVLGPLGARVWSIGVIVVIVVLRDAAITWLRLERARRGATLGVSFSARLKTALLFGASAAYLLAFATFGQAILALAHGLLVAGAFAALISAAQYLVSLRRRHA